MNKQELISKLRKVECQLSPENLCCDGEASAEYVRREGYRLRKERNLIIQQLGYEPTSKELWG